MVGFQIFLQATSPGHLNRRVYTFYSLGFIRMYYVCSDGFSVRLQCIYCFRIQMKDNYLRKEGVCMCVFVVFRPGHMSCTEHVI